MKDNKKTKAKKLTDAICRDLPLLDDRYSKPGDYPGLEFWVMSGALKVGNFNIELKELKILEEKRLGPTLLLVLLKQLQEQRIMVVQLNQGRNIIIIILIGKELEKN